MPMAGSVALVPVTSKNSSGVGETIWGFRNGGGGRGVRALEAGVGVVEIEEGRCPEGADPSRDVLGLADFEGGVGSRATGSPAAGDRWSFRSIPPLIKEPMLVFLEWEWVWSSPE